MDIKALVDKSRKGDISSFMELLKEREELFYKIALAYTKNTYDSEDCISEAAIKGFEKINQLREPDKFYSWFTSILINICRVQYKFQANLCSDENLSEVKDMFSYSCIEDKIIIDTLLNNLKKDEREILVLKYLKDYSIKDISIMMGTPLSTVKSKLYRTLNMLKSKNGELKDEYR